MIFIPELVDHFISLAKTRQTQSPTDAYLYEALDKFPLQGKNVALLDSKTPWYESILLNHGAYPTTLSSITNTDPRIQTTGANAPFDALFSLFQLKSLGLCSTIDPDADLIEMKKIKSLLKPQGLLFLSIPVGKDLLVTNSHRIYGEKRLKLLFKGFRPTGYFGYSYEDLWKDTPHLHEPVIVLKPILESRHDNHSSASSHV